MGTICILLGLIIFIASIGAGFLVSNIAMTNSVYMTLLVGTTDPAVVYAVVVGACAFIGLLICLSLVMSGLTYNRVCKNAAELKRLSRH